MLTLAIKAQLPIISVTSRDTLNLPEVLKELTGKQPTKMTGEVQLAKDKIYYKVMRSTSSELPLNDLYTKLTSLSSTLILVNCSKVVEPMFDAGEVPVPATLMVKFLNAVTADADTSRGLLRGLGGCTIKEAAELVRLTMARDHSLTASGLMLTRKSSFQAMSGLTQVDTSQSFYLPPEKLSEWVGKEKDFFLTGEDPRLIPRGLLLDGPPGVGKTAAAKWMAARFGIPLYRVDIGGTKNKYVGQSEANLLTNLNRLDQEEPCIALLDEVEKVFTTSQNDSSGTTSTMLSQLLWWLAERRSRVLVIMTTNNAKALPKELYREGRIDEVMWFGGLEEGSAKKFVRSVLDTFEQGNDMTAKDVHEITQHVFTHTPFNTSPPTVSQAALMTATYQFIKARAA